MLEGLDAVEWHRLQHAYGSADDVPGLIRDLRSRRRKRRERALWELFGNIHHQGTVYSATAPAVPFLAELVRSIDTDYRVRVELVWLLDAIAGGSSYLEVHRPLIEKGGEAVDEALMAVEREWVRDAREAVRRELPSLIPFVGNGTRELSLSVACLAARFPEDRGASLPRIREARADARDPSGRHVLSLCLLLLGEREPELVAELREAGERHADRELVDEVVEAFEDGAAGDAPFMLLEDLLGSAIGDWPPRRACG